MALLIGLAQKAHEIAAKFHVQPPKRYHVLLLADDDEDIGEKKKEKSLRLYGAFIPPEFLAKFGTPRGKVRVNSSHKPTSGSMPARPETRGMGDEAMASGSVTLIAREFTYPCPQEAGADEGEEERRGRYMFQIALDRIRTGDNDYADEDGDGDVDGGKVSDQDKTSKRKGWKDQQQGPSVKKQKN
ncbi:hypothetical protein DL763_010841 [Monosporascus cannonballus]|nr:hypothetical protein DL763_010841 [Monosporascus cannonballus]